MRGGDLEGDVKTKIYYGAVKIEIIKFIREFE